MTRIAHRKGLARRTARAGALVAAIYVGLAYLAIPELWWLGERGGTAGPMRTTTSENIPGDPINVGIVGSREELLGAFAAAGWHPADAVTLRTSVDIGLSVVLDRPYPDAPVSTLLLDGKPQDFSFERPEGTSADRRHHVRFWLGPAPGGEGRPLWLGAASFDTGVELSHDTGAITHRIDPDLDAERDRLIGGLRTAGQIETTYAIDGIGPTADGRNGGGDRFFTDGMAVIGVLRPGGERSRDPG